MALLLLLGAVRDAGSFTVQRRWNNNNNDNNNNDRGHNCLSNHSPRIAKIASSFQASKGSPRILLQMNRDGRDDGDLDDSKILEKIRQLDSLAEQTLNEQRAEMKSIQESLQILLGAANASPNAAVTNNDDGGMTVPGQLDTNDNDDDTNNNDNDDFMAMMQGPEEVDCDVCIIGGGPAGCTCALFSARAGLKTVLLDKNSALGALAITSHIVNFPGVAENKGERISGEGLLDRMRQQAVDNGADYRRAQVFMIDGMEPNDNNNGDDDIAEEEERDTRYTVYTPDAIFQSKTLVLATGAMGRVAPPFPGEDTYLGMGVSYCATCDGAFYRDAEVAVKGISLEAMEEARFLTKFAKTVHWV